MCNPRRLNRADTFRLRGIEVYYRAMISETENPQEAKSACRVSLRDMLRLIWIDTLRRVHNVGFLADRLNCKTFILKGRPTLMTRFLIAELNHR